MVEEQSDSESEQLKDNLELRRSNRISKKREIFVSYAGWVGGAENKQYRNDNIFSRTLSTQSEQLLSTSATRTLDAACYLSRDGTIKNIHPYAFVAK